MPGGAVGGGGKDGRICVGAIAGAHGVAGAVRIKSFTEDPADVASYGPVSDEAGGREFDLDVIGGASGAIIARIDGVTDRNAAEALKGTRLYLPRDVLPPPEEDEFYHADLLGLDAVLADGAVLGTVKAVHQMGGGDLLEIDRGVGTPSAMVPFTREAVPEIDIPGGRVVVEPLPGLLDEEDGQEHGDEEEDEDAP